MRFIATHRSVGSDNRIWAERPRVCVCVYLSVNLFGCLSDWARLNLGQPELIGQTNEASGRDAHKLCAEQPIEWPANAIAAGQIAIKYFQRSLRISRLSLRFDPAKPVVGEC